MLTNANTQNLTKPNMIYLKKKEYKTKYENIRELYDS